MGMGGIHGVASSFALGKDGQNGYFAANTNTFPQFADAKEINSACNINMRSFGFYGIKDSNPFSSPEIDLALLTRLGDVKRVIRCTNQLAKIYQRMPKQFNVTIFNPPNGVVDEAYIMSTSGWNGHFVGGCRVGGVLRGDLTVHNTEGLRVVDASSLNQLPQSAGPMATVYMLAEYISEVIAAAQRNSTA